MRDDDFGLPAHHEFPKGVAVAGVASHGLELMRDGRLDSAGSEHGDVVAGASIGEHAAMDERILVEVTGRGIRAGDNEDAHRSTKDSGAL